MKLWHCGGARSLRPLWALEEMGLEYEVEVLPFPPRIFEREYLKVNSLGTVPFFIDGETEMTESVGICQYLVDRYQRYDFGLEPTHPEYGAYLNWLHHADATLTFPQTISMRYFVLEPSPEKQAVAEDYRKWYIARLRRLDNHLNTSEYLVDNRFTIADIAVAYALYLGMALKFEQYYQPQTLAYLQRMMARPGFKRAEAQGEPLQLPDMEPNMSTTEQELKDFRAEVAAWMRDNNPADPGFLLPQTFMEVGDERQLEFLREWQHKVWAAGYLGMAWPKEYGGGGVDPVFQGIADQEMRRNGVPICFNVIGLGWAGPLINDIGTPQEKAKYLKGILNAEDVWCQGFSEPDHGSDLGNAQTRAVRDGDEYVLNGQKIWTTMGNFAKYMILLARTNPDAPRKYDGLSYFLSPMHVPGIETRPIRKITGEYGFTETFFTDARIPADCLMGEEGQGWKIAMQTLQYERGAEAGAAGGQSMVRVTVDDMISQLQGVQRDGESVLRDPVVRDQLVQAIMEEKSLILGDKRAHIGALTSDYPGSLPLSNKLRATEMTRRMRQLAINLQGAEGALYVGDDEARQGGFWQRAYFNSFSATIGGGTSQVQANIVAEHILGLPK